jgi:hypothetical protein
MWDVCGRWPEHLRLANHSTGELVRGRCRATNLCSYCQRLYVVETVVLTLDALEYAPTLDDRKLNRAPHMILLTRKRSHPATIAYIQRRIQEGKTRHETNRCLKRYLARSLYRLLEHGPPLPT